MHVTKWGELGILCCMYLAKSASDQPVGAQDIADSQQIPLQYAQQILHRLKKGGIIKSARGPHGGYKLSATPEAISLKDILYAAEGDTFEVICDTNPVHGEKCAEMTHPCGLQAVWRELKLAVDTLLASRSLASVITQTSQPATDTVVQIHSARK